MTNSSQNTLIWKRHLVLHENSNQSVTNLTSTTCIRSSEIRVVRSCINWKSGDTRVASAGSLKVCKCGIGSCFNLDLEGETSRKLVYLLFSRNFLVTLTYAPLRSDKFAANNRRCFPKERNWIKRWQKTATW